MHDVLDRAVEQLDTVFDADGIRFDVVNFDQGARNLRLRLNLADVPCQDCVMPVDVLSSVVAAIVRDAVGDDLLVVHLDDPRRTERQEILP